MKPTYLTDKVVQSLEPSGQATVVWDTKVKRFGVRIAPGGTVTFILAYESPIDRRLRRMKIGRYEDGWSVADARKEAKHIKREEIDRGIDPLEEKQDRVEAPSVAELCDYYEAHHLPEKREASRKKDLANIKRFVRKKLGKKKVEDIQQLGIRRLHTSLKKTPYQANRVLALLSKLFSIAVELDYCHKNPAKGIKRYSEDSRMRFLSAEEIQRLVVVLNEHHDQQAANVVRLCLLTGARSGEVMSAQWSQFDFDRAVWTKPSAHTKQKKTHAAPLSAQAIDVLKTIPRDEKSEYLFSGRAGSKPHLTTIKKSWEVIRTKAKIPDVRLHDLRHTFASHVLAAIGNEKVVGELLGHTQPSTTAKYTHALPEQLRKATAAMGRLVEGGK